MERSRRRGVVPDYVSVLHLLEEGDLADGGGGDALVLLLEADLLERDGLVGVAVLGLVHHPVRALPDLLHLLVLRRTRASDDITGRRLRRKWSGGQRGEAGRKSGAAIGVVGRAYLVHGAAIR
jgi:hypothetical protein